MKDDRCSYRDAHKLYAVIFLICMLVRCCIENDIFVVVKN